VSCDNSHRDMPAAGCFGASPGRYRACAKGWSKLLLVSVGLHLSQLAGVHAQPQQPGGGCGNQSALNESLLSDVFRIGAPPEFFCRWPIIYSRGPATGRCTIPEGPSRIGQLRLGGRAEPAGNVDGRP
jgi:hypothetical protein